LDGVVVNCNKLLCCSGGELVAFACLPSVLLQLGVTGLCQMIEVMNDQTRSEAETKLVASSFGAIWGRLGHCGPLGPFAPPISCATKNTQPDKLLLARHATSLEHVPNIWITAVA